jgi:predicted nucleotidyltransferase
MAVEDLLKAKREEILRVCAKYGAYNVRVFGSVARSEADEQSDIDFLVELEPGRTLFDLGGLQYDLEQLLGCRVDVVTERGLKPRIRERVLREAVPLWLPEEIRNLAPDIPWQKMIGMRNILVHGYFEIDLDVVWDAVQQDVPLLKPAVEELLKNLEDQSYGG